MAHAIGAQWSIRSEAKPASNEQPSIQHELSVGQVNFPMKGRLRLSRIGLRGGLRILLLAIILLACFMFGAFIQTASGSEEKTQDQASGGGEGTASFQISIVSGSETMKPALRHVVDAGETLWSIARQYAPEEMDIRQYIADLREVNGMEQSIVYAGQVLCLPEA